MAVVVVALDTPPLPIIAPAAVTSPTPIPTPTSTPTPSTLLVLLLPRPPPPPTSTTTTTTTRLLFGRLQLLQRWRLPPLQLLLHVLLLHLLVVFFLFLLRVQDILRVLQNYGASTGRPGIGWNMVMRPWQTEPNMTTTTVMATAQQQ